jgi:hypothetical protein
VEYFFDEAQHHAELEVIHLVYVFVEFVLQRFSR